MNLIAFTFQAIIPLAAVPKKGFTMEPFMYLGGGLVTVVVAAVLMHFFIYNPVHKKLKDVKQDKPTPFQENEQFYTQYLIWVSQNGLNLHFEKRDVDVNAVYDEDDE
ncbi:hypothetical protein [Flavobacterium cerinum]|uniref:Uncharacterized protein n=1 Tax=Flavobacterium cerinum TaxID=2502784 RepID=A0A444H930_9FLAO|nr:hypothetical protein [Flavobacterium cerinum]RWW99707.1 hypothetical protein EPI11_12200 [Flavobacterium cerinum]